MIDQETNTTSELRYDSGVIAVENQPTTTMSSDFHVAVPRGVSARRPAPPVFGRAASLLDEFTEDGATRPSAAIVKEAFLYISGAEEPAPHAERGIGGLQQEPAVRSRRERHARLIALIESWLADESGYDEAVWPRLKARIEESRTSSRKRFSD